MAYTYAYFAGFVGRAYGMVRGEAVAWLRHALKEQKRRGKAELV